MNDDQLHAVPGEPDQVPRLLRFRQARPGVRVAFSGPFWRAVIPEPHGETVITRYDLKALLDKLDSLDLPDGPDRGDAGDRGTR